MHGVCYIEIFLAGHEAKTGNVVAAWTPAWSEAMRGKVGTQRHQGIWVVAQLNMAKPAAVGESTPYEPMTITRDSSVGWPAGAKAMLLEDAEGNTWIMNGSSWGSHRDSRAASGRACR
jgi:hypothetical protein